MKNLEKFITISEIQNQPQLWREISHCIAKSKSELVSILDKTPTDSEFLFIGAGSSAFIGEAVAGIFQHETGWSARAVGTTDIVTYPRHYIHPTRPLVIVSFARSGNSPESTAAVERINAVNPLARHLIITCNQDGALAKYRVQNSHILLLPEAANDKGLAMIGSVTGMILTTLLLSNLRKLENQFALVENMAKSASQFLQNLTEKLESVAALDFKRVVCLGSGPFMGLAHEAHLKIQELSDGNVIGKFDSFLGFRHGPKVVVDKNTLMIYFLSEDAYVSQYERDLIVSVQNEQKPLYSIALSAAETNLPVNLSISTNTSGKNFLLLPYLVPIQLLAAYKSIKLGLNPDSPSARGAIHRVVQGVTIYPYEN